MLNKIDIYHREEDFFQDLDNFNSQNKMGVLSFFNHHCYNLCYQNTIYRKRVLNSDFLLRDGSGIKIALKKRGYQQGLNLNGTDLIPKIVKYYDNKKSNFFIFGSTMPWVEFAATQLVYKNNCFFLDGFQKDHDYLDHIKKRINGNSINIILLGMGMPRQENLSSIIKEQFSNYPGLIINGGGVLDFVSNRKKRAPLMMRKLGIEWLFRLIMEPRRLFYRYVIGIPIFFLRILK